MLNSVDCVIVFEDQNTNIYYKLQKVRIPFVSHPLPFIDKHVNRKLAFLQALNWMMTHVLTLENQLLDGIAM